MTYLDDFYYTVLLDGDLPWITYAAGWGSDAGGNALRYTRYGCNHQISGNLKYTGATNAAYSRQSPTLLNVGGFVSLSNPLGNVSYDLTSIGGGVALRAILGAAGTLILYRNASASSGAWALTGGEAFPLNLHWIAPPSDPSYGLGPAVQVG